MTQWSALALSAKKSLVNLVRFTMSAITKAKEVVDWVDFIDFWFDVDVAWTRSRMFIFIGSLRDQDHVGLVRQYGRDALPDQRMIVHAQHTNY